MTDYDVDALIDRQRIGPRQILLLVIASLFCFIDGFDVFMVGKIAPAIAKGFGESPASIKQVIFYQQIGLAIGAFAVSPMADRFGRRSTLVLCSLAFGVLTLVTAYSRSLHELAMLRGVAGVFMSAGLPMALALLAEWTPRRRRATFLAIAMAVYSTGSAASGAVAAFLLDSYGWQSGFWIGGIVPLVCAPLLLLAPESLKYRVERNATDPRIARAVRALDPGTVLTGSERFILASTPRERAQVKVTDIFADGRGLMTAVLWACCFLSMSLNALLAAWLPTFFQEMAGIPIQRFAITAMIAFGGGFIGTLTVGWLLDRLRPTLVISAAYLLLAGAFVALGAVPFGTGLFMAVFIVESFCQVGGQAGLNTFTTNAYPPRMKSTGLGWAGGAGRVGGILIAPAFGQFALSQGLGLQTTMALIAVPAVIVACLIPFAARRKPEAEQPEARLATA